MFFFLATVLIAGGLLLATVPLIGPNDLEARNLGLRIAASGVGVSICAALLPPKPASSRWSWWRRRQEMRKLRKDLMASDR